MCNVDIAKERHTNDKKYFEKHKDNSKKQWQMINKLLGSRKICRNEQLRVKDKKAIFKKFRCGQTIQ